MSYFGLVLHSVGAESCCGVVRQCKDFAMEARNLVARSLCCARSMEVQVDGGILDAKRGFAGGNMGWYQYQPNVELLKQANMWEGLSQGVKDFLSGAEQNEAFKLNKQEALLDMDNTKAHTGLLGTQTRAQEQQIQHNAELHPLQIEGTKTQNAFNKKQYGLLEAYGDKEAQARIARFAHIGQGGRDQLGMAEILSRVAKNFAMSPTQEAKQRELLREQIIKTFPYLDDNEDIVNQMINEKMEFGQWGAPKDAFFDTYIPFAEGKSAQELERYRMLNNPAMQLQNAALGLLGYGNQWWREAPLEIDENWGENLKNMMKSKR